MSTTTADVERLVQLYLDNGHWSAANTLLALVRERNALRDALHELVAMLDAYEWGEGPVLRKARAALARIAALERENAELREELDNLQESVWEKE